jgi:hypothetical protein
VVFFAATSSLGGKCVGMAGQYSATLEGWAVPTVLLPFWDHTYVKSSCGLIWDCRGAATGGYSVAVGVGNSLIADYLSQPKSRAEILYGRNGVCHQRANRILHPANHPGHITVAGCNGYGVSAFRYGTYGKRNWAELVPCYSRGMTIAGSVGGPQGPQGDNMNKMRMPGLRLEPPDK